MSRKNFMEKLKLKHQHETDVIKKYEEKYGKKKVAELTEAQIEERRMWIEETLDQNLSDQQKDIEISKKMDEVNRATKQHVESLDQEDQISHFQEAHKRIEKHIEELQSQGILAKEKDPRKSIRASETTFKINRAQKHDVDELTYVHKMEQTAKR